MTKLSVSRVLRFACCCAAVVLIGFSASGAAIRASAGTTFALFPPEEKNGPPLHTVDGVVQVSIMGNCTVHFDVLVTPPSGPGVPYGLMGSVEIYSG